MDGFYREFIVLIVIGFGVCQEGDFDPTIGFLRLFDSFSQDEVPLPNLTFEDISQNTTSAQDDTAAPPTFIPLPDIQVSGDIKEVGPPREETVVSVVMNQPSDDSSPAIQFVDQSLTSTLSSIVATTTEPASDKPGSLAQQIPQVESFNQNTKIIFSQTNTTGRTTNSAFIASEKVELYSRVSFPPLYRSGGTESQFQVDQTNYGAQDLLSVGQQLLDVGCKPLIDGNGCLYQLLQSITFFYNALKRTGVMDVVCGFSPLTIIAPTDGSFATLAEELDMIAEDLLAPENQQVLLQIIGIHLFVEEGVSPERIVERSSIVPESLQSWLGQTVYSSTDSGKVFFRPPLRTSPTATAILTLSGQNIYLQEGCVVDYLYVAQNVLIPDFQASLGGGG